MSPVPPPDSPAGAHGSSGAPRLRWLEDLGSGSTGRVHRAELEAPFGGYPAGAVLAVKRLHPELTNNPAALEAFRSEADLGARLDHPGVVRVLHADLEGEAPYLVMTYVPGRTLREVVRTSGFLPEPLLRRALAQVAGGLAEIHRLGWTHGDIKPDNLRLDDRGGAVLLDLGFARPIDVGPPRADRPERGSLAYLSPEQAHGESPQERSDVFSLGIVLYELATGIHPFALRRKGQPTTVLSETSFSSGLPLRRSIELPDADRLLAALASCRVLPPSRLAPDLTPFLDRLVFELLSRSPSRRPTSAELEVRLREQESCRWWREQLEFGATTRRGGRGEPEATHLTPLVGRDRELERLGDALARVRRADPPRGHVLWVEGETGSGKSRLVSEFAARARARIDPPLYLYARCSSLEESRPCAPLLRLLQRYLRLPPGSAPGDREREWLERTVPPSLAESLLAVLDPNFTGHTAHAVPDALAEWLLGLGRRESPIVFVDDVNFADEGSLEALRRVAEDLPGSGLLLVLGLRKHESTRRAEALSALRSAAEERGEAERLTVPPLDRDAVLELVRQGFHPAQALERIADVLMVRSRGNSGLLTEILRTVIDRGDAHPAGSEDPRLILAIPPDRLPLPASLHGMITERARALRPSDRRWLEAAAVAGGRIHPEFLARAFGDEIGGARRTAPGSAGPSVDEALVRLSVAGWLVAAGPLYRFARPAQREAIYRAIPESLRQRWHARAAEALYPGPGRGVRLSDAFQRAFHLRKAGEHAALLRLLRPLMDVLLKRGQPQRVHTLARWGVESLDQLRSTPERERTRIHFLEVGVDAADRLGRRNEERRWLDRLTELQLDPVEDAEALCRIYLLHGRYAIGVGRYGLARGMLRNAVEFAESDRVPDILHSEALRRLAAVQAHVGELREAGRLARRALELAVHDPQRAVAHLAKGTILLLRNRLETALGEVDLALRLMRDNSDWELPGVFAAAHMLRGRIYRVAGRPRRALGSMHRAMRLAKQAGERRLTLETEARAGGLLFEMGRVEEAEERLRNALLGAGEIEDRRGQALASLWLGTLLVERSEAEGLRLLDRAGELGRELGLNRVEALSLALQTRLALRDGRTEWALQATARATHLLEAHGAELLDRISIVSSEALVLDATGKREEAEQVVRDLRRQMRRETQRIQNRVFRERHRSATTVLLEQALDPEGPRVPHSDPERAGRLEG